MTKQELYASAHKQAENVARLHSVEARRAQVRKMLATLLEAMRNA